MLVCDASAQRQKLRVWKKNPYFLGGAAKNQESSQLEPNVAKRELDPHLKHQGVNTLTVI